jgi:hypothetical protein
MRMADSGADEGECAAARCLNADDAEGESRIFAALTAMRSQVFKSGGSWGNKWGNMPHRFQPISAWLVLPLGFHEWQKAR